jgi:hypothetical protein
MSRCIKYIGLIPYRASTKTKLLIRFLIVELTSHRRNSTRLLLIFLRRNKRVERSRRNGDSIEIRQYHRVLWGHPKRRVQRHVSLIWYRRMLSSLMSSWRRLREISKLRSSCWQNLWKMLISRRLRNGESLYFHDRAIPSSFRLREEARSRD